MNIKGLLIEGTDGQEYLLGFGRQPTGQLTGPPTLSRRGPDGTFEFFENTLEASKVVADHTDLADMVLATIARHARIGSARGPSP